VTINKWGGLASFFLSVSFVVAPLIYLTGNLGDALGIFAYNLADFLYGPILSASLIVVTYVLRERIGESAFRRMDLALVAAILSAVGMAAVAFIRASNRHYHFDTPRSELGRFYNRSSRLDDYRGRGECAWISFSRMGICLTWFSQLDISPLSPPAKWVLFSGRSLILIYVFVPRHRRACFIPWCGHRYLAGYFVMEVRCTHAHQSGLIKAIYFFYVATP
jgi:hypothetical protein